MKTLLYVHAPSSVTIRGVEHTKVAIARYGQEVASALGTLELEPGIYAIHSPLPVDISIDSVVVVTLGNDKDDWPDPKANVIALEPGATAASIKDYIQAKDESPGPPRE